MKYLSNDLNIFRGTLKNNPRKCNSVSSFERSTLQLMTILERNEDKDRINTFLYTSKTHSTLEEKKFIPLFSEHLHFLIKRADLLIIHIYIIHLNSQNLKKILLILNKNLGKKPELL